MSVKRTVDIHDENDEVLEHHKTECGLPYGTMINGLIKTVCRPPERVRTELLTFVKQRLHFLYRQMDEAGGYEAAKLMEEAQTYRDLAKYLNNGRDVDLDEANTEPIMVRIQMYNSYIIVPDDWIILNREEAEQNEYALVVEVRQGKKTKPIPHFVYFHDRENSNMYDKEFCDMVNKKCAEAYPDFQEFINFEKTHPNMELVPDPDHPGEFLNAEEVLYGPQIGHFAVYVQGDRTYGSNYEPPYGVRIVRTKED